MKYICMSYPIVDCISNLNDQPDSQELVTGWYNFDCLLVCIVILSLQRRLLGAIIGLGSLFAIRAESDYSI